MSWPRKHKRHCHELSCTPMITTRRPSTTTTTTTMKTTVGAAIKETAQCEFDEVCTYHNRIKSALSEVVLTTSVVSCLQVVCASRQRQLAICRLVRSVETDVGTSEVCTVANRQT